MARFTVLLLALFCAPVHGFTGGHVQSLQVGLNRGFNPTARPSYLKRTFPLFSDASGDPDAIMSDDPMIVRLEEECARMNGADWNEEVGLVQLLNPSKVVNLERDLIQLREELEGAQGTRAEELKDEIETKEAKKTMEMRGVMRDWLKAVFVWQSVLSVVVCGLVSYDAVPFFPHLELYVRVLGFWGIWLFTIPSLRSRKPGGVWGMSDNEKSALDQSFLLTPIANIGVAQFDKDPVAIFWANVVVLACCYAWNLVGPGASSAGAGFADASLPEPIKFALQAIDFGSGSERGLSKATRERVQERNQRLKEEAEAEGAAEEAESK
mmetsp:Transcript_65858/g.148597  ORF Transcript_65858/g.148597 Transcript_65858/m.148597 type:complete len:324 (-) Transcript_65858:278-1249(-)